MQSATAGPVPPGGSLSINNDCPDLVIIVPDNPAPTLDCSAQVTNTGLVALAECMVSEPRSNTIIGPFNLEVGEMSGLLDFSSPVTAQDVIDMTVTITVDVVCLDSGNNAIMDSALESIEVRSVDGDVDKNCTPETQAAPGTIDWDWTVTNTSPDGKSVLDVSCDGFSTINDPEVEDDLIDSLVFGGTASNLWSESGLDAGTYENEITCTFTAQDTRSFERMASDSCEVLPPVCGNGAIESGESCDDSNTSGGDGCNATCTVESGWTCDNNNPPSVCTLDCIPSDEVCDGIDNDCNEAVDEDLGTLSCGVGECAVTVEACFEANEQVCTPLAPIAEVCDGLDNNCDGTVDSFTETCYTGPAGTEGVGECIGGIQACVGGSFDTCTDVTPSEEICDGLDNNCDGNTDEGNICVIPVDIDIKPGSDPNCFNNDGHGVIPVAILGSATFDATQVDPLTLSLDSQTVKTKGNGDPQTNIEDVNGDGFDDLVVKIIDADGTYAVGTGTATLTGQLFDGTPIEGTDSICITQ